MSSNSNAPVKQEEENPTPTASNATLTPAGIAVVELLTDYLRQTIEEAKALGITSFRPIKVEEEGDDAEVAFLKQKIVRIHRLYQHVLRAQQGEDNAAVGHTSKIASGLQPLLPSQDKRGRVSRILTTLMELEDRLAGASGNATATTPVKPVARSVTIEEATQETYRRNTQTLYKKQAPATAKRFREDGSTPVPPTATHSLEKQREARRGLYTAKYPAHFPALERQALHDKKQNLYYFSPAIQRFSQLNMNAKLLFLEAWTRSSTKTMLVRELHSLYTHLVLPGRHVLATIPFSETEKTGHSEPYFFRFLHYNEGIVRLCVQDMLYVDLTFHVARKVWVVLRFHFHLSIPREATTEAIQGGEEWRVPPSCTSPAASEGPLVAVRVPRDRTETMRVYLMKQFVSGGIEEGAAAATQLTNALLLDNIVSQLRAVRDKWFPPLLYQGNATTIESLFRLHVRRGNYVSLQLVPPQIGWEVHSNNNNNNSATENKPSLLLQFKEVSGVVLCQYGWSHTPGVHRYRRVCRQDSNQRPVLCVERLLWEIIGEA
ncbi:hypothetical protein ADEAN_000360400 [Angomonas deanei]|uniref:Uncharacterized protein n=1 Tax=Angomonas deanei TaxID=59799 RepID=A0A7G2CBM7_9TRYP|nr:hypothetical protein ADEAN_000360400 [Angomonas deanei]